MFALKDRQNKAEYRFEISRERAVRVVKIYDAADAEKLNEDEVAQTSDTGFKFFLKIEQFGLSIINQKPREIAYLCIKEITLRFSRTFFKEDMNLEIDLVQFDNQMTYNPRDIVLAGESGKKKAFLDFGYSLVRNEGMEHITHFQDFRFSMHPIVLILEG